MVTETIYYTVEYLVPDSLDLWLFSANEDKSRELTEDEARDTRDRLYRLGFRYRVHLHEKRESRSLVEDRYPV